MISAGVSTLIGRPRILSSVNEFAVRGLDTTKSILPSGKYSLMELACST
jgi:hypothetical protein